MASAEEAGQIVLELSDTAESQKKEVFRSHTSIMSQATKAPVGVNQSALQIVAPTIFKGKRLIMSFIGDSATDIIESEESDVKIPINILNEQTKAIEQSTLLTLEMMTGFKPSGTVDINTVQSYPIRVASYDAPVGKLITLAGGQRIHAYIGDDS